MECKEQLRKHILCYRCRINRNIMECKVIYILRLPCRKKSINRNIMECKAVHIFALVIAATVLIETLWNVKKQPDDLENWCGGY